MHKLRSRRTDGRTEKRERETLVGSVDEKSGIEEEDPRNGGRHEFGKNVVVDTYRHEKRIFEDGSKIDIGSRRRPIIGNFRDRQSQAATLDKDR